MNTEQKEETERPCSSTQAGKENGHRHECHESQKGAYRSGIQDGQVHDREGQTSQEGLEKRILQKQRAGEVQS